MLIVNEISLNKIITYTNSVYHIEKKFKGLSRKNCNSITKASTVAKTLLVSFLCGYKSINLLNEVNSNNKLNFKMIYKKREYNPKMHGLRDCVIDTDYQQLEKINQDLILKSKENKIFKKNTIDGLCVMAWDGVELNETNKAIIGLPEREYGKDDVRKYIKYLVGMNVGERANIIVTSKQLLEVEKITTKNGNERAKTIGETKAFEEVWKDTEKLIGRVIDVHVFDALYLNQNIVRLIDNANKYFVIRLKEKNKYIYEDAKQLFNKRKADNTYEIVEKITEKNIKYSKNAKKKNITKTKVKRETRKITTGKLGEKILIEKYTQIKKNSVVEVKIYERVITRKEVWDDIFELTGYEKGVRVIRSIETSYKNGKASVQEIYLVTNMKNHNVETILKIMHARWNIENCGFRTLKQRYNINHIFIGELNAINYIVQMIFLVFNLLELYTKYRLKAGINVSWSIIFKSFERDLHSDKTLHKLFNSSG